MLTWVVIGGGAVVITIGSLIRPKIPYGMNPTKRSEIVRSRIGMGFWLVGVILLFGGIYAGFKGPIEIGRYKIPRFEGKLGQINFGGTDTPLGYAKWKMRIFASADLNLNTRTYRALRFNVNNKGDRVVRSVTVRLETEGGMPLDVVLKGPFPAGQKKKVMPNVPRDKLIMFKGSGTSPKFKIVSASF